MTCRDPEATSPLVMANLSGSANNWSWKPEDEDLKVLSCGQDISLVILLQEVRVMLAYHAAGGLPLVVNTDDFIVRLIKGCAQLGLIPEIYNTVNMVPVDHVARIVTAAAFHSVQSNLVTLHVTGHPRSRFVDILSALSAYGFKVSTTDYVPWRIALERYTIVESRDNALYPLLHFVLDNLPQSTKAPELDDRNTQSILEADEVWTGEDLSSGKGVTVDEMGIYLAYLIGIGFLEAPQGGAAARALPRVNVSQSILNNLGSVGGRGGKS